MICGGKNAGIVICDVTLGSLNLRSLERGWRWGRNRGRVERGGEGKRGHERCLAFICQRDTRCFVYGFDAIHTVFAILIFNLRCSLGDT